MRASIPPAPRRGRSGRSGRAAIVVTLAVVVLAGLFLWLRPGGGAEEPPSIEVLRARERAAAAFAQDFRSEALAALEPLLTETEPAAEDLVRGAIVMRTLGRLDEARDLLVRALAAEPDSPAAHYNLGQLALFDGDFAGAAEHLQRTYEIDPEDVPTRLALAQALEDSDPAGAEGLYKSVVDQGFDFTGSFYLTGLYRLAQLLARQDRGDDARALLEEFQRLQDRGFKVPTSEQVARGNYGELVLPGGRGEKVTEPGPIPTFGAPRTLLPELAGAVEIALTDLDNDCELDVLARGPFGLAAGLRAPDGTYTVESIQTTAPAVMTACDVDNDDDLDLVLARDGVLLLFSAELSAQEGTDRMRIRWEADGREIATLGSDPAAILPLDFDHDGDLDLALAGPFGARILRNDAGGTAAGAFVDASAEAGLADVPATAWVLSEDFDTDQDVDLLFGGAAGLRLASNARAGRFEDQSDLLAGAAASDLAPVAADLDGDGLPDLVWRPDATLLEIWTQRPSGRFERSAEAPAGGPHQLACDLDLDGAIDLVFLADGAPTGGLQSVGLTAAQPFELALAPAPTGGPAVVGDVDADLAFEILAPTAEGIAVWDAEPSGRNGLLLSLRGQKDNRRGIGALVELRGGTVYQRTHWRGGIELVGCGGVERLDWLRITWPNGVIQYDPRLDVGDRRVCNDPLEEFTQDEGLVGSCPFLYTWNGATYEFISDVIGITPLGLPMAPGVLVPPDHDEYVLVRGDQLVAKDGFFEIQLTEELREVSYFDRVRLDVVDHPAGTRVYPNERFTFPPFPEHKVHTVREPLAPTSAEDGEGRDWTGALAAVDDEYAAPFEPAPSQYLGLATPHVLELAFDPDAVRDASMLRLVMTGWFYWTDASVNVAVARDPEWSFVPPILSVPDGEGGWRETGPPLGFPAGKTKTMVIDVTDLLNRDDPRIRLFSTLRLYWDAVHLAVDSDDADLRVMRLEPADASLWRRGFSDPQAPDGPHQPLRFEWEQVSERPRWNPHPGLYTKLGDCGDLLETIDDRMVVMGTGEALTVRFDARDLPPPPPGFERDYLVFLDGWAKDRDPNTIEALYTEPLPFHGMSGYPYDADESFPDTPAHKAWRGEWLVRPAEPWFEEGPPVGQRP